MDNLKLELPVDDSKPLGMWYIIPYELGDIPGYYYSIRDFYKLTYKVKHYPEYEKVWLFERREKTYSYKTYVNMETGEEHLCSCENCLEGRKNNPGLINEVEVLFTRGDLKK